jgi:hypothetical protein
MAWDHTPAEPAVLASGKQFHKEVEEAYVAELLGVTPKEAIERTILGPNGTKTRADLLLLVSEEPERQRLVIEIKSTEWTGRSPKNRRALFLRHLHQIHKYLDVDESALTGESVPVRKVAAGPETVSGTATLTISLVTVPPEGISLPGPKVTDLKPVWSLSASL